MVCRFIWSLFEFFNIYFAKFQIWIFYSQCWLSPSDHLYESDVNIVWNTILNRLSSGFVLAIRTIFSKSLPKAMAREICCILLPHLCQLTSIWTEIRWQNFNCIWINRSELLLGVCILPCWCTSNITSSILLSLKVSFTIGAI